MIWTPSILPPHPSTIPSLSPLAQSVLALISQEAEGDAGKSYCVSSYRATHSVSSHDRTRTCLITNCQRGTRIHQYEAQNDLFDFQASANMSSLSDFSRPHASGSGTAATVNYPNIFASTSYATANSERTFRIPPRADTNSQHSEPYLSTGKIYSQVQLSQRFGEQIGNRGKNQYQTCLFEPLIEIRETNVGMKQPYENLSPDMEFDDMEVYSCPFGEEGGIIKKIDCKQNTSLDRRLKVPVSTTAKNGLNFREVKPRPLQTSRFQIKSPLTPVTPLNNKILGNNKMVPSDQTFAFADANPNLKFQKQLAKFKNTCSPKLYSKIKFIQKTKKAEKLQSKSESKLLYGKNICNEDVTESVQDNSLNKFINEKENDDTIENHLSDFQQKGQDISGDFQQKGQDISGMMKKQTQEEGEMLRNAKSIEDSSTHLQKNSEELFVKTQENVQPVEGLSQFPKEKNLMNFTTNDASFNQQSELSENLFVKTQESIFYKDLLENRENEVNEKDQSEELSIPPYQIPKENNESPDFNVDDLFSLKDESLRKSLAMLKQRDDKSTNLQSPETNEHEQVKRFPIDYNRTVKIDLTPENLMKSQDLRFSENSWQINSSNHMKHKTDGDTLLCKDKGNAQTFSPLMSPYFQPTDELHNSKTGFQRVSMKKDKRVNKENLYQRESPSNMNYQDFKIPSNIDTNSCSSKDAMEVDIETEGGNIVPNPLSKKSSLKQSTLFDCRKFLPGAKRVSDDSEPKANPNPNKTTPEAAIFKKPLPPGKKAKTMKASPKEKSNAKKPDKISSLIKPIYQMPSKNNGGREFLHSNTPLSEIKQKCDPTRMVQTSLIKNEPVKKSADCMTKSKKSKTSCFVPPMAASHLTSQEKSLKNYTVTVMDDVSANEILQRLNSEEMTKVVTTVTFKEGYTLLNKPEEQKKNSQCLPSGVLFMIVWEMGKHNYYWLSLLDTDSISPSVKSLVNIFMTKSERNICFEAQAVYMLLMDVLKYQDISNWNAYDPLIGCWLLDPDNPPKDFQETTAKLEMDRNLLAVNPRANTKNQACDLLPVLDVAMNILQNRLVNASLWTVFSDMETKLIPILAVMESSSILIDVQKLHKTAEAMNKKMRNLQGEAHLLADRWFQLNSPQQLREILFDKLKLDEKFNLKIKKTEHGVKSTSETVLELLKDYHPLPKIILEYRRLHKLKSTYVDGLLQHVKSDGTIGTSWEQVSAATGRITSKNPNFQAFPKCPINVRDGETIHPREMFKAREGSSFLAADFQQIEFRVFAHFTQDKCLLQAFHEGGDIFQRLAERWLGGKGDEEREKTKRIVYSVMYGAGASRLSEYLHIDPSEANKIIDNFVAIFPSLRSLPRTVIAQCRARGFVVTLSGRRRLFPHIRSTNGKMRSYSERQAMNFLIQGSAADICKAAMLDCEAEIRSRGLRATLLLMIHDELVWEVDDRDLQETSKTVREAMEHRWSERLTLLVPLPVCISKGKTLADMQPMK